MISKERLTSKIILFLLLCCTYSINAQQGVGINTDNSNPDASAILDVKSTTQGVLVPRMTEVQKTAIPVPATGLLIYQTDAAAGFWYFDGSAWQPISAAGGEFQSIGGLVQNTTATATDDFVFGSTSLDDIAGTDDDYRMFFDKSKGAFRAGVVTGTQWDDVNVGLISTAMGYATTASGDYSTAMGYATTASGYNSMAMGRGT
ncbi:MAG: hypothetical protein GY810_12325, partial [Aureispira sp.]|nr:hypothetical protein [Aureispira sp.]